MISIPTRFLGRLWPKNNSLWVFCHQHGFGDNAGRLANYVSSHHPEIQVIWFGTHHSSAHPAIQFVDRYTLQGIAYQLKARVVFVSTGLGETGIFCSRKKSLVFQLWHGWHVKRILMDSCESYPLAHPVAKAIWRKLLIHQQNLYSAIFCHNKSQRDIFASAFGVPFDKLPVTGWPRLSLPLPKRNTTQQILYAPTWLNDSSVTADKVNSLCCDAMHNYLERFNLNLCIKLHPFDAALISSSKSPRIQIIARGNIDELLASSIALISDYSSIMVDAKVVYQLPVYFFTPDRDEYIKERGLYAPFELLVRDAAMTIEELLQRLEDGHSANFGEDIAVTPQAPENIFHVVRSLLINDLDVSKKK